MTPAEHKSRCLSAVGELLDYARVKRNAAEMAKQECDVLAQKRLVKEAALMESSANLLDPAHESEGWKTRI